MSNGLFRRLYLLSLVFTILVVFIPLWKLKTQFLPLLRMRDSPQSAVQDFQHQWCRLQRWRVDWEQGIHPCKDRMSWDQREPTSRDRSSAYRSYIDQWQLRPTGQFSRFFIQSVTNNGRLKNFGGDSWRVYIRQGPSSLAPLVLDHYNGLYEVLFLVLESGSYSVTVYLDHTLCDGYRDPPIEWFTKGVDQGRYRAKEINNTFLGNIDLDYINKPLGGQTHFSFDIQDSSSTQGWIGVNQSCGVSCSFVWDGHGRWVGSQWRLYPPHPAGSVLKPSTFVTSEMARKNVRSGRMFNLMILGDSNARRFTDVARKRPLCRTIFKKCDLTEIWVYNVRTLYPKHKVQEGDPFNQDIILQQYRKILSHPDMNRADSVLLFNMGIHYSLVLNFTQYQTLVNSVIKLLTETTADGRTPRYKARVVWRGTTMIEREKLTHEPWPARKHNFPLFRFHTNQRIQFYHAYATRAMCRAGIKVLDMYPLSAAYPKGTVDNVHYDYDAFDPAVKRLEEYFLETL